jgi:hypothetical protein
MWRRALLLFGLGLVVFCPCKGQDSPHLYPIVENGKLGFINGIGKEIIPPRFNGYECFRPLPEFNEGLAPIHTDPDGSRWGYIDTTGKLVFSLPPDYSIRLDLEGTFHEGIAIVSIIAPSAGGVRDQLGWIDRTGHLLHLDIVGPVFGSSSGFHEGLMRFPSLQLWGYVDHSFQWVIPPQFHTAEDFQEGIALVSAADARLPNGWAYIDKTGKILFRDTGKYGLGIPRSFSDGLAEMEIAQPSGGPVSFEFVDVTGQLAIGPTLGMARDFHEGYVFAFVGDDGHLALIDKQGRQTKLDGFGPNAFNSQFHEGLAAVDDQGSLYGYIDPSGKWVIPPQFDYAERFSDGVARVEWRRKREWGYIDKQGRVIWRGVDKCQYPAF